MRFQTQSAWRKAIDLEFPEEEADTQSNGQMSINIIIHPKLSPPAGGHENMSTIILSMSMTMT